MYKVVKYSEATIRQVAPNKTAHTLITKDDSAGVSFTVIEATNYDGPITATNNWIYFVLEGTMTLVFDEKPVLLSTHDCCYVTKGQTYQMTGTFKSVVVSQPAFGT